MFEDLDYESMTPRDAVGVLQDIDRAFARLQAIQADVVVVAATPEPQVDEYVISDDWSDDERRVLIEDPIRDELACALRRSSGVMQGVVVIRALASDALR